MCTLHTKQYEEKWLITIVVLTCCNCTFFKCFFWCLYFCISGRCYSDVKLYWKGRKGSLAQKVHEHWVMNIGADGSDDEDGNGGGQLPNQGHGCNRMLGSSCLTRGMGDRLLGGSFLIRGILWTEPEGKGKSYGMRHNYFNFY